MAAHADCLACPGIFVPHTAARPHHATFYFVLFASLGLVSPYLGLWLHHAIPDSFSLVLSGFYLTLVLVPAVWGHFAFASDRPGLWLRWGALIAALTALGLTQISGSNTLGANIIILMVFGIFFNPLSALLDAIVSAELSDPGDYARVRSYGSIGFMVCSFLVGGTIVLDHPDSFPFIVALSLALVWWFARSYSPIDMSPDPLDLSATFVSIRSSLSRLFPVWWVALFTQASFACYYTFFAMALQDQGVSSLMIGFGFAVATASEVVAFRFMDRLFNKVSPWTWIMAASLCTAVRWLSLSGLVGFFLPVVLLLQCTQALGFSLVHTACMTLIRQRVPEVHLGVMQGVYNALGFGLGGTIGVFLGAIVWNNGQHARGLFELALALALLAALGAMVVRFHESRTILV